MSWCDASEFRQVVIVAPSSWCLPPHHQIQSRYDHSLDRCTPSFAVETFFKASETVIKTQRTFCVQFMLHWNDAVLDRIFNTSPCPDHIWKKKLRYPCLLPNFPCTIQVIVWNVGGICHTLYRSLSRAKHQINKNGWF